tara:strand:+ start:19178 stop:20779 length:1602 start_codon:yes stop_codon:yes gene_type:complete
MAKKRVQIEIEAKTKGAQKQVEELKDEINNTTDAAEDLGEQGQESSKQISKGMDSSTTSVTGLIGKLALAATAMGILSRAVKSNQFLADKWNTAYNFGTIYVNKLGGEIERLWKTIQDFSPDLDSITEKVQSWGESLKNIFFGDLGTRAIEISKISKATIEANEKANKSANESLNIARDLTDLQNRVPIAQAQNRKLLEQYNTEADLQRRIRDNVLLDVETRTEANNKLGVILDKQEKAMLANAQLEIDLAAKTIEAFGKNTERRVALIDAETEKAAVLATVEGFRNEQDINRVNLLREETELKKIADEEEEKKEIEKQARIDKNFALLDKIAAQDEAKQKKALADIEELKQARINSVQEGLQAVISAAGQESKIGRALFLLKQGLLIKEQIIKAKANISDAIAKGAQASVDASAGMVKATASAPPPLNLPIIATYAGQILPVMASIIATIAQAKQMSAKAGGGGFGGGVSLSSPQAPAAAAPNFNIVGAAAENQLAQTISQQNQTPVKAFVVSNDVTTAQSMDRNIIESSSI